MSKNENAPLISISNLSIGLPIGADRRFAVDDISLDIHRNEILCIVGESGSGKSLTASAIMGLLPKILIRNGSGSIVMDGEDLSRASNVRLQELRGRAFGMVFQEPLSALNPLMQIGDQIEEVLIIHKYGDAEARKARVRELVDSVGLPDPERIESSYPFQLSGGQRQRAIIAMAIALEPPLIIADEPTTALDVTTQAQVLALLKDIQKRKQNSILFITHDFGVVAEIADRVAVMQEGKIVEIGSAKGVLTRPKHAYTKKLIAAIPGVSKRASGVLRDADGIVLSAENVVKTFGGGGWFCGAKTAKALDDVSFSVKAGTTLGVVGESGSGKSTLARCLIGLERADSGRLTVFGDDMSLLSKANIRRLRQRVQMVFQDPFASLNPRQKVETIVTAGPIAYGVDRKAAKQEMLKLLDLVGIPSSATDRFPHEFSGGQRQRIGIARALALNPEILIADEAVSALDVSVQEQILALFENIKRALGITMLFITHDLRVAAQICDEIIVMQHGRIVEHGVASEVLSRPSQDYTKTLLNSVPGKEWLLNNERAAAGT